MRGGRRFRRWIRDGGLAGLGLLAVVLLLAYGLQPVREPALQLRLTAGNREGTRTLLAETLAEQARGRNLQIRLVETRGSEQALELIESGACDLALVQGGLAERLRPHVRQVAALHVEPLHLLLKPGIERSTAGRLSMLEGKRINLGERGSGTYCLASAVLAFVGLEPGHYVAETRGYSELLNETDLARLPDAAFTVSTLPSRVARHLVVRHGYSLVELPFAEAFALSTLDEGRAVKPGDPAEEVRREHVYQTTIPAFTYDVEPGAPPEPARTLGTRLLLVARDDVPLEAIARLLEIILGTRFSQVVYPPLTPDLLNLPPEMTVHDGTVAYLHRAQPLSTGGFIDLAEKWLSMTGVATGGAVCLWQWARRRARLRQDRGFESYILKVADVERRAAEQELSAALDLTTLFGLSRELAHLKQEALEKFASGELDGEDLMSGFLTHVSDTRGYLTRLILHQRDNIEEAARLQGRPAEALWGESIKEPTVPFQSTTGQPGAPGPRLSPSDALASPGRAGSEAGP